MDRPPFTPPRWLNVLMVRLLRTPGLQRLLGRSTALLTFTGRRSGRSFTTPVSYVLDGDRVLVTAHPTRTWWRNLADRPRVGLRLAGVDHTGTAAVVDSDEVLPAFCTYLAGQPRIAGTVGVDLHDGHPDPLQAAARLAETVVVEIALVDGPAR